MAPNHGPLSGGSETASARGSNAIARDHLRAFIERIERLEEEKKAVADDIKEVFAEAKGSGFDTKIMRQVLRIRKQDKNERDEQLAILDMYLSALGMQASFDFDEPEREEYELKRGGDGPGVMMNAPDVEPAHNPETGEIIEDSDVPFADEPDAIDELLGISRGETKPPADADFED